MSNPRQQAILKLIGEQEIDTQERLRALLMEEGFSVTQATISRDIRQLRLRKVHTETGVKYARASGDGMLSKLLFDVVTKVDYAMNIVVVHCLTGTAQAAATVLDGLELTKAVGSIAGDDTIFLLARSEADAKALQELLQLRIWGASNR